MTFDMEYYKLTHYCVLITNEFSISQNFDMITDDF